MADDDDPGLGALFASFAKKTTKLGAKRPEETRQSRLAIGTAFDQLVQTLDDADRLDWFRALEEAASVRGIAKIGAHPKLPASLARCLIPRFDGTIEAQILNFPERSRELGI